MSMGLLLSACSSGPDESVAESLTRDISVTAVGSWSNEIGEHGSVFVVQNGSDRAVQIEDLGLRSSPPDFLEPFGITDKGFETVEPVSFPVDDLESFPLVIEPGESEWIIAKYEITSCDDLGDWSMDGNTGLVTFSNWQSYPFQILFSDGVLTTEIAPEVADTYQPSVCEET